MGSAGSSSPEPKTIAKNFAVKFLLDLVFPVLCQNCGAEGVYLCVPCQQKITAPASRCVVCGKTSLLGLTHPGCSSREIGLSGLLVAAEYEYRPIRDLVWHFKYSLVRDIGEILATILVDFVIKSDLQAHFETAAIIPVPLHPRRQRLRGFNQAELIAYHFAKKLGLTYLPILKRMRPTRSQVDLPRGQRLENVQDAFTLEPTPSLGERKIILLDDVATTGATLNECAKVLRQGEPREVWGLVVARN